MPWLLPFSVLAALLGLAVDRFGHELCHRGFPLAAIMVGLPAAGAAAACASLLRRSRAWLTAMKLAAAAANLYLLVAALIVLAGVGIASCG